VYDYEKTLDVGQRTRLNAAHLGPSLEGVTPAVSILTK
jgi:hypothetical protein